MSYNWYIYTFGAKENMFRFNTHHFPVGTVVRFQQGSVADDDVSTRTFEVQGITRNAPQRYVIDTAGVYLLPNGKATRLSVNIDHVIEIVKRGNGPLLINHGAWGLNPTHTKRDLESLYLCLVTAKGLYSKGYFRTYSPRALALRELLNFAPLESTIDWPRLVESVYSQSWCKHQEVNGNIVEVINKKRLRAFLRRNLNRFLKSNGQFIIEDELHET